MSSLFLTALQLDPNNTGSHHSSPYHTTPYHTLLHYIHTISNPTTPNHTIPYHTTPYQIIPHHTIPYHTTPYHTIPYQDIPYHTIPHHTYVYFAYAANINFTCQPVRRFRNLLQIVADCGGSWRLVAACGYFLQIPSHYHSFFPQFRKSPPTPKHPTLHSSNLDITSFITQFFIILSTHTLPA